MKPCSWIGAILWCALTLLLAAQSAAAQNVRFVQWDRLSAADRDLARALMYLHVARLEALHPEETEWRHGERIEESLRQVTLGRARITQDSHSAVLVMVHHVWACGTAGCPIYVFTWGDGIWWSVTDDDYTFFGHEVELLPQWDRGYRRIRINGSIDDDSRYDFVWTGRRYLPQCLSPPSRCGHCEHYGPVGPSSLRCAERPGPR